MFYPLVRLGVASCLIFAGQIFALPKYSAEGERAFDAASKARDKAVKIANFKRAAELDFPQAWTELAACFRYGNQSNEEPTPEQEKRGVGFLWEGVKRGHPDAVEALAEYYWWEKTPEKLNEIAQQYYGTKDAKVIERHVARWLADQIDSGEGIRRMAVMIEESQDRESVRIFLRSMLDLEGTVNWALARAVDVKELIRFGVSLGIPEAIRHWGKFHLSGAYGLKEDEQEGLRLLRAAAEAGDEEACLELIEHFEHKKQPEEVRRWLLWGAERKMWEVSHHLAGAYYEGKFGFKVDTKSAVKLWTAAAEAGHVDAGWALRDWHEERGEERSAERWRRLAEYGPPALKREPFMHSYKVTVDRFVR
jgi:uncharacterized protein